MPWVRIARLAKPKAPAYPGHVQPRRIVIEIIELPDAEIPPGAGFSTRHEAKASAERKVHARPLWSGEE